MNIKFTSRGIPELQAWINTLPYRVRQEAARWVSEYLIGNSSRGLKHYPPYKHIPWAQNMTNKQRRWLFAAIKAGLVDPGVSASNGYMADGWQSKPTGAGAWMIFNDVAHTKWLVGNESQSRHSALQGWRKVSQIVADNLAGAIRHANSELKKWLKVNAKKP